MTDYPEAKWAIPGLIPDGVTILAGPKSRGKSFISLDNADHLLSKAADAEYVGKTLASWASRYLEIDSVDQNQAG